MYNAQACMRIHATDIYFPRWHALPLEKRMLQARPCGGATLTDRRFAAPGALCTLCRHRAGLRADRRHLAKATEGAADASSGEGGGGGTGNLLSTTIR